VSVQHVALETDPRDARSLSAFFELLGFEEVEPPPALRERALWLERLGTQIHVLLTDDPVAPPKGHVAVVAPDYEDTLARLRAAGHQVDERAEHWGSPRCFARAPGGHRVEIMARAPG
jgi:catechol 2,3-dioxygenase-like lactoylglutathione lyase family enzyme